MLPHQYRPFHMAQPPPSPPLPASSALSAAAANQSPPAPMLPSPPIHAKLSPHPPPITTHPPSLSPPPPSDSHTAHVIHESHTSSSAHDLPPSSGIGHMIDPPRAYPSGSSLPHESQFDVVHSAQAVSIINSDPVGGGSDADADDDDDDDAGVHHEHHHNSAAIESGEMGSMGTLDMDKCERARLCSHGDGCDDVCLVRVGASLRPLKRREGGDRMGEIIHIGGRAALRQGHIGMDSDANQEEEEEEGALNLNSGSEQMRSAENLEESEASTPTGRDSRIPEPNLCPPAPKKPRCRPSAPLVYACSPPALPASQHASNTTTTIADSTSNANTAIHPSDYISSALSLSSDRTATIDNHHDNYPNTAIHHHHHRSDMNPLCFFSRRLLPPEDLQFIASTDSTFKSLFS